ncbi:MAG TPA: thioesterase family protein [Sphingomonas sp.]|jgi:4-hydroxybenzoyl-CoA thioesterase
MATYRASHLLRFAHCDPAGIAFYPRYFELLDAVVEDWTAEVIGVSRRAMHQEHGLGLPTVSLEAKFMAMSRLGDRLDFALDVERLGHSSIAFAVEVVCAGERRFAARLTQVLVRLGQSAAQPWPDEWRARIEERRDA